MQITKYLLILLAGFSMAACSGSADSITDVIPDVPGGGGDDVTTQDVVFNGVWLTACQQTDSASFRSRHSKFTFEGSNLTVKTFFYADQSCSDERADDTMTGPFELSRDNTSGDNFMQFNAEMSNGSNVSLYMRTMMLNDGRFIVTRFKSSEKAAEEAVADTPLYRQDEWDQIKENF